MSTREQVVEIAAKCRQPKRVLIAELLESNRIIFADREQIDRLGRFSDGMKQLQKESKELGARIDELGKRIDQFEAELAKLEKGEK